MMLAAAGYDWTPIIALTSVVAAAVAGGGALRTVWGSRRDRREGDESRLERIELLLVGKAADPKYNMPAVPGMVDEVRSIRSELKFNGGNSLKDSVVRLAQITEDLSQGLTEMRTAVTELREKQA